MSISKFVLYIERTGSNVRDNLLVILTGLKLDLPSSLEKEI